MGHKLVKNVINCNELS